MLRVPGKFRLVNRLVAHKILTTHNLPSKRGIGRDKQRAGQVKLLDDGFDLRRYVAAQNRIRLLVNPIRTAVLQHARRLGGALRGFTRFTGTRVGIHTDEVGVAARCARKNDLGSQTMPQTHRAEFGRSGQIVCENADHLLIIPLENVAWLICFPEGSQHVATPSHRKFRQVETDFFWPLDQNWVQTALPSGW